jgi:hypothetical protein
VSASPSEGYQDYTKGDYASLPTDTADLETPYSEQEVLDVATNDGTRVSQSATGEFAIHQFKDWVGSANSCTITWEGQTNCPPSLSTVYLQIFNPLNPSWDTLDTDNTSAADTDFTLTVSIPDLTNYKSVNQITCRIFQEGL